MNIKTVLYFMMLSALFLTFVPNESLSQRVVRNYNEAITANPLSLYYGILNVNYEMQVSKDNSLTMGAVYSNYSGWTGIGLQGSYKWYLFQEKDKAIQGFGFGPSVNIAYFMYENDTYASGIVLAPGFELSYKFIIDNFVLEPVGGFNYNLLKSHTAKQDKNVDGLKWQAYYIGINIGYAW
jgi:hypothetical protein